MGNLRNIIVVWVQSATGCPLAPDRKTGNSLPAQPQRLTMTDAPKPVPRIKPKHFPPPPPLVQASPGLWRRTPPAIFPPMMGLFGLGLGWRTLAAQPGMLPLAPIGEAILGAVLLLFGFSLVAYLSKPLRRPGVLWEDLAVLPGRAGLAAMVLCIALAAAAMVPYQPAIALVLVSVAFAFLVVLGGMIGWAMVSGPQEARAVTPVFHLTFAGYILMPLSLIPLGYLAFAKGLLIVTILAASAIWLVSFRQLVTRTPPAPLRPLLAIYVAPASLFAIVSAQMGYVTLAIGFALFALALLLALLASVRWLLVTGFSPLWGALTFPLAASGTASIQALGAVGFWVGAVLLIAASALNPWVTTRVVKAWAKGQLAMKTNAATA